MTPLVWLMGGGAALLLLNSNRRAPTDGPGVVERGTLTSGYLVRRTATHLHRGVDISAPRGTPIRALADGRVLDYKEDCARSGYGNALLVEHDDGYLSFYAHLERLAPGIREGSRVRRGQTIAYVGTTNCRSGASTPMAPHLHLEVHTATSQTPTGHYVIAENVPSRVDPETYMSRVGVPVSDRLA